MNTYVDSNKTLLLGVFGDAELEYDGRFEKQFHVQAIQR